MRFSPSKNCFYPEQIHYPSLPDDLINVPDADYIAALNKGPGQTVTWDGERIVLQDLPAPPTETLRAAAEAQVTNAVQAYIDAPAKKWGYDDARSAISYVGDTYPRFDAEGQAIKAFRSACWQIAEGVRAAVLAGERTLPSAEEMISLLPEPPLRPEVNA